MRQLIVETVHTLKVTPYVAPNRISLVAKEADAKVDSAEGALTAHFSAMKVGSTDWFLRTWVSSSSESTKLRMFKGGKNSQAVAAQWAKNFTPNTSIELVNQVEVGSFLLIEYRFMRGKAVELQDTVALKKTAQGWRLTQELASDPILSHWNEPTGRVMVPSELLQRTMIK